MINCLISNCAGRHTTHVPAGGAAERFILFNNKSKTNVAFCPLPACMGPPAQRAGQWHLARARVPSTRQEGAGAELPSWQVRIGIRVGTGEVALEWKRGERKRDCSERQHDFLVNYGSYVWAFTS